MIQKENYQKRSEIYFYSQHRNTQELVKDISEVTRKVRLIEYFDGMEDNDESLVRNKSNIVPKGRKALLDASV